MVCVCAVPAEEMKRKILPSEAVRAIRRLDRNRRSRESQLELLEDGLLAFLDVSWPFTSWTSSSLFKISPNFLSFSRHGQSSRSLSTLSRFGRFLTLRKRLRDQTSFPWVTQALLIPLPVPQILPSCLAYGKTPSARLALLILAKHRMPSTQARLIML